jgi:hypothetical protein
MATKISTAAQNAALDAINTLLNAGAGAATIKIYTGSQPSGPGAAATGTLLAELTCSDPAAPSAASGVLTFSAITSDTNVNATGTAGWGRIADSDGNAIIDFSVTATGGSGDVTFDSVSFIAAGTCAISALTLTCPASE